MDSSAESSRASRNSGISGFRERTIATIASQGQENIIRNEKLINLKNFT